MATTTITLACTKSALVYREAPDTNYHGEASYRITGDGHAGYNTELLLAFDVLPDAYRYRNIYNVKLVLTTSRSINLSATPPGIFFGTLEDDFPAASVTWNSKPDVAQTFLRGGYNTSGSGDETVSITAQISGTADEPEAGVDLLQAPAVRIRAGSSMTGSQYVDIYTEAAASGKRPYLEITMGDDDATLTVSNRKPTLAPRFACNEYSVFSWEITKLSGSAVAPIIQDSATLYWKKPDDLSWNSVSVSGSSQQTTIPANTLPAEDILWYVVPVVGSYTVIASADGAITACPRVFVDLAATAAAGAYSAAPDDPLPWNPASANTYLHYKAGAPSTYILNRRWYFMFEELPAVYRYKALESAGLFAAFLINPGWAGSAELWLVNDGIDSGLTWNTAPGAPDRIGDTTSTLNNMSGSGFLQTDAMIPGAFLINGSYGNYYLNGVADSSPAGISQASRRLLAAPALLLQAPQGNINANMYAGSLQAPVVLRVILGAATVTSKPAGTANTEGFVDPHEDQTFPWEQVPDGELYCAEGWDTASATFYWSSDDGSTWNSVAAAAGAQSVTVPAETFPSGTILWKVTATDDQGTTAPSDVYMITTEDSPTTATPVSPINTVEDGSGTVILVWETSNDHNTDPTGADIQISDDGTTWTDLASITGSATRYDAPPDTFIAGQAWWRVRAYNSDGVVGDWSDAAGFLSVNAPRAPVVSATAVPFSTVSWQSEDQQAWRLTVDDAVTYGPYFGSARNFQLPDYLADGGHTISVEVQGLYGKWSRPGTTTVQILNALGAPIRLRGTFYRDAVLSWSSEAETSDFLIYRDGAPIGHTSGASFSDRTVLGVHAWQVINRLPGGNYSISNPVQGELKTCSLALALLSGGDWLELKMSNSDARTQAYTQQQTVVLRQYAGEIWPQAEVSPYLTMQVSFDAAWTYAEEVKARTFEAMIGQAVIYKAPGGEAMVGILSAWNRQGTHFYRSYAATVQRIHWREYVDEDD